ncbi:MAG TPA: hypothetical protein PKW80_13210 [Bacteroidales bacterium]|nr:hypothetical protein [Bacteroidales bacterium]
MLITKTAHIVDNQVLVNGNILYHNEEAIDYKDFIKSTFRQLCPAYPKFFKMDNLCKLAFLASEVLLKDEHLTEKYPKEEIGLIIMNASSSIDVDKDHQQTINSRENYFPSPSFFVYTLPNVMLGEICIKNHFFGENAVYISEHFDADTLFRQVNLFFNINRMSACITGWIENNGTNYEAFLMLVEVDLKVGDLKEICNFAVPEIYKLFNRQ